MQRAEISCCLHYGCGDGLSNRSYEVLVIFIVFVHSLKYCDVFLVNFLLSIIQLDAEMFA